MFFDESCTISTTSLSVIDGEQVAALVTLEDNVPCVFYAPGNSYAPGQFAQNQGTEAYVLVIRGDFSHLPAKGRIAEINGKQYIIETVQVHKYPNGAADNAECRVVERPYAN